MIFDYLGDAARWQGDGGIGQLVATHLAYTGGALLVAGVLGIALGMLIGRTPVGSRIARALDGLARPIPAVAVLVIAIFLFSASSLPIIVALALIAFPSVLAATARGVDRVDASTVTAARALGMSGFSTLRVIIAPLALPSILHGLGRAAVQITGAAALAAVAGARGLGQLIIAGNADRNYSKMFAGAILIAGLAVVLYVVFGLLAWSARRRSRQPIAEESFLTEALPVS